MRLDKNFIVPNQFLQDRDKELLFGDEQIEELQTTDIFEVLVVCGIFPSKSQARKNWNRGEIKDGWNDFDRIGKLKHRICVWVPVP